MGENQRENLPIDRGWAWVVCAACFVEVFLFGGVVKSFGIFFVEYLEKFDTNASSVTLVLSVQSVMSSIVGLLGLTVGPLICSHRRLTIFGGILLFTGYLVNAFAPNISVVLVGTGILFGVGASFTHGPATVMVGKYFKKRIGFANGIFKVGAGLGSFAFPPLLRYLLDTYGLQGALLIVAGLLLNIVPCGALLRPIEFYHRSNPKKHFAQEKEDLLSQKYPESLELNRGIVASPHLKTYQVTKCDLFPFASSDNVSYDQSNKRRVRTFTNTEYTFGNNSEHSKSHVDNFLSSLSTNSVAVYGSVEDVYGSIASIHFQEKFDNETNNSVHIGCWKKIKTLNIKEVLNTIFDRKLLRNRLFLLFLASTSLSISGVGYINSFIPPHAKDTGIDDKNISILLSIFGGADLLGRLLMASIADLPHIRRYVLLAATTIISGGMCQLIPLLTSFWSLAIFSGVTGLCAGFYFAIVAVVLIDFVGIQNLSSGYGIYQLTFGLSITATTPVLGVIRDNTTSYIGSFYLLGCCLLAAGLLLLLEPSVRRCQEKCNKDTKVICV